MRAGEITGGTPRTRGPDKIPRYYFRSRVDSSSSQASPTRPPGTTMPGAGRQAPIAGKHLGEGGDTVPARRNAHQCWRGGPGGIEERAEKIENGALAPLRANFARGADVPQNRVVRRGAKKKAKRWSRSDRAVSSGDSSILTPKASRTSALPAWEVTARLPCLATGTPAAAHIKATVVDMLKVLSRFAAGAADIEIVMELARVSASVQWRDDGFTRARSGIARRTR